MVDEAIVDAAIGNGKRSVAGDGRASVHAHGDAVGPAMLEQKVLQATASSAGRLAVIGRTAERAAAGMSR